MSEALAEEAEPKTDETAQAVFWAWERLRLFYNLILVAEVGLFACLNLGLLQQWQIFFPTLVFGALGANLCFCIGPVSEGYWILLGADRKSSRAWIFMLGTLIAMLLTLLVLMQLVAMLSSSGGFGLD
ncbi:MAG: hypothetical protein ACAI44_14735 [Candidatus Sericytochromatia bacterium]